MYISVSGRACVQVNLVSAQSFANLFFSVPFLCPLRPHFLDDKPSDFSNLYQDSYLVGELLGSQNVIHYHWTVFLGFPI